MIYAFKMFLAAPKNLMRSQNWWIFWPVVMSLLLIWSCFDETDAVLYFVQFYEVSIGSVALQNFCAMVTGVIVGCW